VNPTNRLLRMTRTVWQVFRMALEENADLYHFHDPELIPVGIALKIRGKRVVYDVHETVSKQIRSKSWIPHPVRVPASRAYRVLEQTTARVFDGVVVATPGIAEHFPTGKATIVQNYPLAEKFSSIDTSDYHSRESVLAYVGGITHARGIEEMVEALGY